MIRLDDVMTAERSYLESILMAGFLAIKKPPRVAPGGLGFYFGTVCFSSRTIPKA